MILQLLQLQIQNCKVGASAKHAKLGENNDIRQIALQLIEIRNKLTHLT